MHTPVLLDKVVEYLDPKPNENFIDGTIGEGGHSRVILEKIAPRGKILGIDWDPEAIQSLKQTLQKEYHNRILLFVDNFAHIAEIAKREKFSPVQGIILDLGFSSAHIETRKRGFSFQKDEVLDMRYNLSNPLSAEKILNYWSRNDIERILKEYGEEEYAKQISKQIVEERSGKPIQKTSRLVNIIQNATPRAYHKKKIHPATKTFQALRIAVNNELQNVADALTQSQEILRPGGKMAVISFHSLEDRLVKNFFRENAAFHLLCKKPITPSVQEIAKNPRARSAKLRVAQKSS